MNEQTNDEERSQTTLDGKDPAVCVAKFNTNDWKYFNRTLIARTNGSLNQPDISTKKSSGKKPDMKRLRLNASLTTYCIILDTTIVKRSSIACAELLMYDTERMSRHILDTTIVKRSSIVRAELLIYDTNRMSRQFMNISDMCYLLK
ncbi:hypothetical protein GQR58_025125 [Nymphon striatum]|nr:hypothetical protein GQR58_025125 [Nymphon striatum]